MQFAPGGKEKWDETLRANPEEYGRDVLALAEHWAEQMEAWLKLGESVSAAAVWVADAKRIGASPLEIAVTGYQRDTAWQLLIATWAHGDQLQKWYSCSASGRK